MKTRGLFKRMEVIKNIGLKSVIATALVFLLTVVATIVGGFRLYQSTKDSIELRGKVNAVQSAKELDSYLIVRKNTVVLAAHVVGGMIGEGKPNAEILDYITAESLSIKKASTRIIPACTAGSMANTATASAGCRTTITCRPSAPGIRKPLPTTAT